MASSPKTGSERANSLTSTNTPTSSIPAKISEASENSSRGSIAAFKEKVKASLAARDAHPQGEVRSIAESSAVPAGVPRDANQRIINPGGRMILTPPDTQDEQTPSGQERDSFRNVKSE